MTEYSTRPRTNPEPNTEAAWRLSYRQLRHRRRELRRIYPANLSRRQRRDSERFASHVVRKLLEKD